MRWWRVLSHKAGPPEHHRPDVESCLPHRPLGSHVKCVRCGYDLFGGTQSLWRCPECGKSKPWRRRGPTKHMRKEHRRVALAVLTAVVVVVLIVALSHPLSLPSELRRHDPCAISRLRKMASMP